MPESNAIAVALLYQAGQLGSHLKNALGELGAAVVYEAAPASVDRDALENSGARVVIVNLDAESDNYIDALYDMLDAGDYEVVFNDAQVSSNLQGWDQARWVRHLGSKILRKPEIVEPPRPPGA
ncbi:MAG TPA: chemotaxis protein CheB, partial [Rudaea sp.]|nr:chemotaxis protein CheB [Rudaea sp.]